MEWKRLLTQPAVFDSALLIPDPSVLTSLMRKSRRTEFKFNVIITMAGAVEFQLSGIVCWR